jgi:hypothetical protein
MEELVFPHHPEECRHFIDATSLRLRTVLLQNGILNPSILAAFSVARKDAFGNMAVSVNLLGFNNAFGKYVGL